MLVVAHHSIQNPEQFWAQAKQVTAVLPPNLKLHLVFPSKDMRAGTCLWEADSASLVQRFLDENVGEISKNFCYEVNEAASVGLPDLMHEQSHQ